MPQEFDPYHRWLGIAPEEQPPDHYRLLGIPRFEGHADVIENAADRQMAFLRTLQTGPHGPLSQKLLNEVAAAKVCLLNPRQKAAYDARLQGRLQGTSPAAEQEAGVYDFIDEPGPESYTPPPAPEPYVPPVVPEVIDTPPTVARRHRDPGVALMIGILAFGLALVIVMSLLRPAGQEAKPPGPPGKSAPMDDARDPGKPR